jgi:tryptophan synthase alpha chain
MRPFSSLPIAVGFGISTAEQVADVHRYADAVVVGSAIVAEMERLAGSPDLVERIGKFGQALNQSKKLDLGNPGNPVKVRFDI